MNPQLRYQKDLDESLISEDEDQRRMVSHLQNLFEKLVTEEAVKPGIHARVWRWFGVEERRNVGTRGIYLWGGVGRGKTYLMDLFYDCLPFEKK